MIKLHQTPFFHQFTTVVAGLLLAVGSFAFITIPIVTAPTAQIIHLS